MSTADRIANTAVPNSWPEPAIVTARPRFATNQLAGGTMVSTFPPKMPKPVSPETRNSPYSTQMLEASEKPAKTTPTSSPAATPAQREPCLSTKRPRYGANSPPLINRIVIPHTRVLRCSPRSTTM